MSEVEQSQQSVLKKSVLTGEESEAELLAKLRRIHNQIYKLKTVLAETNLVSKREKLETKIAEKTEAAGEIEHQLRTNDYVIIP